MSARILLLLLAALLAACSPKHPPADWSKAHWGMMRSEVSSAVPGLASGSNARLATGATADMRLDKAAIAGTTLPADFFFLDGTLQQITFGDTQYHDNGVNAKSFDRIAASLRSQYGQEASSKSSDPSLGLSREATWVSGDTEIALVVTPVTGTTSMVTRIFIQ
jgi:guanyl-specific ribonuclease Sa